MSNDDPPSIPSQIDAVLLRAQNADDIAGTHFYRLRRRISLQWMVIGVLAALIGVALALSIVNATSATDRALAGSLYASRVATNARINALQARISQATIVSCLTKATNVQVASCLGIQPGAPGRPGVAGVPGVAGLPGAPGPSGTGLPGIVGKDGARGLVGAAGPQGSPGDKGADSTVPGPAGVNGKDGAPGADSTVPGPNGKDGVPGPAGVDGKDGTPGQSAYPFSFTFTLTDGSTQTCTVSAANTPGTCAVP